jgi:protein-L-isoaspartate(D-aspartate) O-methyltransferase
MAEPYARFEAARLVLALRQVGVTDQRIAEAMEKTLREPFVPAVFRDRAWENVDLPIDCGQVLTRPVLAGQAIAALGLQREHTVLEIGTGTGYPAAVMSRLCRRVYSIDRFRTLITRARITLDQLGVSRVELRLSDGRLGWPEAAPFDRIIVWAALEETPFGLLDQLATGGVLVAPVTRDGVQQVMRFETGPGGSTETPVARSRFTPIQTGVAREL